MTIEQILLRPLRPSDFAAVLNLWSTADGVVLRDDDSDPAAFARFLRRNRGLSWGAWQGKELLGAALAGHDGRRGYLYHLAVRQMARRKGTGKALLERVLAQLQSCGLSRAHVQILGGNQAALEFWTALGWQRRNDLVTCSRILIGRA